MLPSLRIEIAPRYTHTDTVFREWVKGFFYGYNIEDSTHISDLFSENESPSICTTLNWSYYFRHIAYPAKLHKIFDLHFRRHVFDTWVQAHTERLGTSIKVYIPSNHVYTKSLFQNLSLFFEMMYDRISDCRLYEGGPLILIYYDTYYDSESWKVLHSAPEEASVAVLSQEGLKYVRISRAISKRALDILNSLPTEFWIHPSGFIKFDRSVLGHNNFYRFLAYINGSNYG